MKNTKIATVYQLIKFTASLLHSLDKSWPNRNNPSKFAVLQYRFRKSSNEFRQSSVFRRPQHGFFDLLHHSGLTLNRYGVALPRLAVLSVLSAASSPCPDLNLIRYTNQQNALFLFESTINASMG
ncbi:hypothetical protein [Neisseria sicca]|nr:hypothetical protein [Neisseria sicca]QMT37820.1 hypothetical protein H3L95_12130 [Neisseria sicca]